MKFCKFLLCLPETFIFLAFSPAAPIVKAREVLYSISMRKDGIEWAASIFPLLFIWFCHNLFQKV